MNEKLMMAPFTKWLIIFVIIVHIMFFALESIFWMLPQVHDPLLGFLDNPVTLTYSTQALVLRNLFINQGFYNLFLVIAGVIGLVHIYNGKYSSGYTLLLLLCFSAIGAGVVLMSSTKAYLLAIFQAVPAIIGIYKIYPLYRTAQKS